MIAKIHGTSIHYLEEGSKTGPTILFVHGFPFNLEMWKPQMRVLKNTHHLIAYDLCGHGKSSTRNPYTIEEHVDDLFVLCTYLEVEKPILVGLSMGGYIALRAVESNQKFFGGLALCNTKSEADTNEGKLKRFQAMKDVRTEGLSEYSEGVLRSILRPETLKSNPDLVDHVRSMITSTTIESIVGNLLAMAARTDTTAALSKFNLPVAIFTGEQDNLIPIVHAESMHAKIPNSTLHVIPNAAHLSNLENPNMFNQHLINFLNRVGG